MARVSDCNINFEVLSSDNLNRLSHDEYLV